MKTTYKFALLVLSLIILSTFTFTEISKAANPNIEFVGPVINNDPWPANYTCGSIVSFAIYDVFGVYVKVNSTNLSCPVTLEAFFNPPSAAALVNFFPPLPVTVGPAGTINTQLVFTSAVPVSFSIKFRARDCEDTSFCFLDFAWVLPVELSSFVSVIHRNDVTLNWSTATETNNERFDIERSNGNSEQWSTVGSVHGFGNSTLPVSYSYTDRGINAGNYNYRLKQIDFNGNFEYHNLSNDVIIGIPGNFDLSQNYPNPFNPSTKIDFEIPKDGNVNLTVYDNSGKMVSELVNGFKSAGYYSLNFNASNLSSGIYYYKIQYSGEKSFEKVMKMALVK